MTDSERERIILDKKTMKEIKYREFYLYKYSNCNPESFESNYIDLWFDPIKAINESYEQMPNVRMCLLLGKYQQMEDRLEFSFYRLLSDLAENGNIFWESAIENMIEYFSSFGYDDNPPENLVSQIFNFQIYNYDKYKEKVLQQIKEEAYKFRIMAEYLNPFPSNIKLYTPDVHKRKTIEVIEKLVSEMENAPGSKVSEYFIKNFGLDSYLTFYLDNFYVPKSIKIDILPKIKEYLKLLDNGESQECFNVDLKSNLTRIEMILNDKTNANLEDLVDALIEIKNMDYLYELALKLPKALQEDSPIILEKIGDAFIKNENEDYLYNFTLKMGKLPNMILDNIIAYFIEIEKIDYLYQISLKIPYISSTSLSKTIDYFIQIGNEYFIDEFVKNITILKLANNITRLSSSDAEKLVDWALVPRKLRMIFKFLKNSAITSLISSNKEIELVDNIIEEIELKGVEYPEFLSNPELSDFSKLRIVQAFIKKEAFETVFRVISNNWLSFQVLQQIGNEFLDMGLEEILLYLDSLGYKKYLEDYPISIKGLVDKVIARENYEEIYKMFVFLQSNSGDLKDSSDGLPYFLQNLIVDAVIRIGPKENIEHFYLNYPGFHMPIEFLTKLKEALTLNHSGLCSSIEQAITLKKESDKFIEEWKNSI